jgi:hypothetical protein
MRRVFILAWLGGWLALVLFPGLGRLAFPLVFWAFPLTLFALAVSRLVGWWRS